MKATLIFLGDFFAFLATKALLVFWNATLPAGAPPVQRDTRSRQARGIRDSRDFCLLSRATATAHSGSERHQAGAWAVGEKTDRRLPVDFRLIYFE